MSRIVSFARLLRKNPTYAEGLFWNRIRGRKLLGVRFRRQHIIRHSSFNDSSFYFIADFYVSEKKLIIELDGELHSTQKEYDSYREGILTDMGYTVIRFTNDEIIDSWISVEEKLLELLS
jgi:very-short-patch-repair endonuclease